MSFLDSVSKYSVEANQYAKKCFNQIPAMKEGVFYSFVGSMAVSAILSANLSTAVVAGMLGSTISAINSLAVPLIKKATGKKTLDFKEELVKNTVSFAAALMLAHNGQLPLKNLVECLSIQTIFLLTMQRSNFPLVSNQVALFLKV